jgi:hypothetical protein
MSNLFRPIVFPLAIAACLACILPAQASMISWDINSTSSYIRLTVPDQNVSYSGITLGAKIRDANNTKSWSDAGGRKANLDGTIAADWDVFRRTLDFLTEDSDIQALDNTTRQFQPNPAAYDPNDLGNDQHYVDTSTAPAPYGGQIRASTFTYNLQLGLFAFRDVLFDLDSSVIAMNGFNIGASQTTFGISELQIGLDGAHITSPSEIWIPDVLDTLPAFSSTNLSAGSILDLGVDDPLNHPGEHHYRLTMNVNTPFSLSIDPVILTATMAGVIVADGYMVPEPTSLLLLAGAGAVWAGYRRRGRR